MEVDSSGSGCWRGQEADRDSCPGSSHSHQVTEASASSRLCTWLLAPASASGLEGHTKCLAGV